jgi:hypothetical protein
MAKDGKHVIHAGGIFPNPQLNREGSAAAAFLPGTVIFFSAAKPTPSVDGAEDAILYVANYDYLRCKTVDDAYAIGDWVVNIQPTPGVFLNVRAAAGTYTKGSRFLWPMAKLKHWQRNHLCLCRRRQVLTATAGDLVRVVFK